ncbi:hypothetical protein JRQ81_003152 [Phrynocephalus forsythii]|uniref:Reverse transcriptase domain-containing protein n=1 Tax=Phrynocephalus forsythii TaxID=171643 RepID=A0A9Q0XL73_9SAUR|nr:hypothetical protein JRQ81_003152 [Phrynocephalus forsythii]
MNIFMADLEQHILKHCTQKPLLYLRYIDDIFLIWTHGEESLKKIHQNFNGFHPNINLTLEQSTQHGHLSTSLYQKTTDWYTYLHSSSFHPEVTTKSIVYSQALRYDFICSDPQDRDSKLNDLQNAFLRLQHPPQIVKEQINKVRRKPRSNLLQDRSKGPNERTPLVVTYSPQVRPLTCILNDLQPIHNKNTPLYKALGGRPILAYRQPPKLKQILIHTTYTRLENSNMDNGTRPCHKP